MTDATIERLVELPRRVVKQPTPELNPGGDCGACVLAGLLGLSIEDVYRRLQPTAEDTLRAASARKGLADPPETKGKVAAFSFNSMAEALRIAYYDLKLIDRYVTRTPMWPVYDGMRAWGDAAWSQSLEWRDWLTMAFEAGYYAIAQVRAVPEPGMFETNHWVLYCGTRTKWNASKGDPARSSGELQLLVSDSGRTKPHEAWFEIGNHLRGRGGFAVMLARPVQ